VTPARVRGERRKSVTYIITLGKQERPLLKGTSEGEKMRPVVEEKFLKKKEKSRVYVVGEAVGEVQLRASGGEIGNVEMGPTGKKQKAFAKEIDREGVNEFVE